MSDKKTESNSDEGHKDGIFLMIGLLFNAFCWAALLVLSFIPWVCIFLIIKIDNKCRPGSADNHKNENPSNYGSTTSLPLDRQISVIIKKKLDQKLAEHYHKEDNNNNIEQVNVEEHNNDDMKNSEKEEKSITEKSMLVATTKSVKTCSVNMDENYSKENCCKFIKQFRFWSGFGTIVNSTILWSYCYSYHHWTLIHIALEWQIAAYSFFIVYGSLILFQAVMETFYPSLNPDYEKFLLHLFGTTTNNNTNPKATVAGTKGILLHYAMIAVIVALTIACISQQIIQIIENSLTISFTNVYSWISIIITNILLGCKLVVTAFDFMVTYYLRDDFIRKLHTGK